MKDAERPRSTQSQAQQATLERAARPRCKQAKTEAPIVQRDDPEGPGGIPPTADQQGFIRLLQNAAVAVRRRLRDVTPTTPIVRPGHGISTITNPFDVTGSYFSVNEFLFKLETLPRAAEDHAITSLRRHRRRTRAC